MVLYMDIHRNVEDIKKEQIDEAHKKDLAMQRKYGVGHGVLFDFHD